MQLHKQFISTVLSDVQFFGDCLSEDMTFSINSKVVQKGDIFIALQGATHNGHDFVIDALNNGAGGLMVTQKYAARVFELLQVNKHTNTFVIVVQNTLEALFALASSWRLQFAFPIVAIVGSVGKTSTKELIGRIMRHAQKNFFISRFNQNSLLGVALNLLCLRSHHEGAILELGVNKRGEMERLVHMARPTTALITNVGHSHMEGLGSLQDIALEKRTVFKYFAPENIGIINGDIPLLSSVSYSHPVIKFGSKTTNQIQARKIKIIDGVTTFTLKIYGKKHHISINNCHAGFVFTVMGATAVCHLLNIADTHIIQTLAQPFEISERFETCPVAHSKGYIINDAYNANPESMKAALLAFEQLKTEASKVAVIGDMLELGINSAFWHRQVGRFLKKVPSVKHVILVGDMVQCAKKTVPLGVTVETATTWKEVVPLVKQQLDQSSVILVKGSFGTGLRDLVHLFEQKEQVA